MATIAEVASRFMSQSSGLSPAVGLASGYAKGTAAKEERKSAEAEAEREEKLLALKEKESAETSAMRLAKLSKDEREELRQKRVGIGTHLYLQKRTGHDISGKIEALKKASPELMPANVNEDNIDQYLFQHDTDGKVADLLVKLDKQVADRQAESAKMAETKRHHLAQESISQNKAGTTMEVGPDGTMRVSMGGTNQPLSKKLGGKVEEKIFNAQEAMQRLKGIREAYDPESLQLSGAVTQAWASAKSYLNMDVSPEEKEVVYKRVTLQRRTSEHLNDYVKEMSGAATSVQEAERLAKSLPTGNESPVVFEAKLEDSIKSLNRSLWRYNYAMRKGLDPIKSGISIYDMDDIIEREGQTIELDVRRKNPGIDDDQVDDMVRQQLVGFFGTI